MLDTILSKLLIEERVNCEHIHGELKDKSIILGIDENVECFAGYHIFIKPVQPAYSSHPILEDLYFADDILFFGMSFGDIDYPYFQMFLKIDVMKKSIMENLVRNALLFSLAT